MSSTKTEEIPVEQWKSFFDAFSREHERWLVTVELLGPDLGAQVEGRSMRFEGISADLKDSERAITIMLGDSPEDHLSHTIAAPVSVRVEQSVLERGTFEALAIESADGVTTLIRFLAGVTPSE